MAQRKLSAGWAADVLRKTDKRMKTDVEVPESVSIRLREAVLP